MSLQFSPFYDQVVLDQSGDIAVGGSLNAYYTGTSNPAPIYNEAGNPISQPLVIGSDGRVEYRLDTDITYRIVLKDSADVTLRDADGVKAGGADTVVEGLVKVSANDSVDGYLEDKIVAGANVTFTTLDPAGNESISVSVDSIPADSVTYDNTTSGLTATDAQGAIDEIDAQTDTNATNIATNTTNIGINAGDILVNAGDIANLEASKIDSVTAGDNLNNSGTALNPILDVESVATSSGPTDAGKLAEMDATGHLNQSIMPHEVLNQMGTGVNYGLELTKTGQMEITVGIGEGYSLSRLDPLNPTLSTPLITTPLAVTVTDTVSPSQFIFMDALGAITIYNTQDEERKYNGYISLGAIGVQDLGSGPEIAEVVNLPNLAETPMLHLLDLAGSVGIVRTGAEISTVGGTLNLAQGSGDLLLLGANFHTNAQNPNHISLPGANPLVWVPSTPTFIQNPPTSTIDPNTYLVGGVSTTVPNNRWTIQRMYIGGNGFPFLFQGQDETFGTMNSALDALAQGTYVFTNHPLFADKPNNAIHAGDLIVKKNTTDLSTAFWKEDNRFGLDGGGGGGAGGAYLDKITTDPQTVVGEVAFESPIAMSQGAPVNHNLGSTSTYYDTGDVQRGTVYANTGGLQIQTSSVPLIVTATEVDLTNGGTTKTAAIQATTITPSGNINFPTNVTGITGATGSGYRYFSGGTTVGNGANILLFGNITSGGRLRADTSTIIEWTNTKVTVNRPLQMDSVTTTEKNALTPSAGWQVYDSTLAKMCFL